MTAGDWRPIVAALANPDTRAVFAEIVLGADDPGAGLSPSRRGHALDRLRSAGVIDDEGMLDAGAFARVLAAAPKRERPTGVDRFLDADGRIDRYPSNAAEREALFAHIATHVLAAGEVVDERELTERLTRFTGDPAGLRRHLVDAGIVERTRSGSEYALARVL
ncbi:DUF2087 domain-containing protein [Microbacterium candidum]|uniref:DUF2087 domain-containing protein n=1 Tax=Microbacterium candidum TaxID=3041922 RepID=A0ABT7MZ85_9MICO|nr:DUF2087 domain-containing protein [Microbacterium sp. ASV49]MDL9979760.1 DUF2087 domain-containing protein [Microbacterium sp. ASV49]